MIFMMAAIDDLGLLFVCAFVLLLIFNININV